MAWQRATPTQSRWSSASPSSGAARSTSTVMGNRTVVFAGHGSFNALTDAGAAGTFVVPKGITIIFWCLHGNPFAGSNLDNRMHIGDFKPQDFNASTPDQQQAGGPRFQMGAHKTLPEVFKSGDTCRQYRLTPPTGLFLGNRVGDDRFITVPDRGPQNIGYKLEDLLKLHSHICANANVHWAACRSVKQR
jgi:hypothetical protein